MLAVSASAAVGRVEFRDSQNLDVKPPPLGTRSLVSPNEFNRFTGEQR
jgi:hypothetical protein